MQTYRKIRLVIIVVVIVIGAIMLSDQTTGKRVSDSFTPEGEVHNLLLDIGRSDVNIVEGDDFKVEGKNLFEGEYRFEMEGDTLVVETGNNDFFVFHIGVFDNEEEITITIPSSYQFEKIEASVGSGDIVSKLNLQSDRMDITTGSGDFDVRGIICSNSSISVGSGTVMVKDMKAKSTEVVVGSGDIDLGDIESDKSSFRAGSGDILFKSLLSQECSLETGSGEIDGSGLEVTSMKTDVGSGDVELKGIINGESSFDCGSGDIILSLKGNIDDYSFDVDGEDVEINGDSYEDYRSDTKLSKHLNLSVNSGSIQVDIK